MDLDVTIYENGMPRGCDTEGCWSKATSMWSPAVMAGGASGGNRYACGRHSPAANTAAALPSSFHSQSLCHACGQPVNIGSLITSG